MYQPHELGKWGEDKASEFLLENGYKIIQRNWYCKGVGEIDIIAKKGGALIFVEVKTIEAKKDFSPEDEIDERKIRNLRRLQWQYLKENKISFETPRQIDIIAVEKYPDKNIIRHHQNVLEDNF